MKANISHVFGLAIIASCIAVQAPSRLVYSSSDLSRSVEPSRSGPNPTSGERAAYGDLPLSFEVNRGQADARVEFFARASGYNLYLTANEAVMSLHAPARPSSKSEQRSSATTTEHSSSIGMRLVGANTRARIVGLDELPGKSNYFIGSDPKKWRLNIPNYSRVKYQNAYPGLDVVFYGKGRQLEYDFIVAPGASFKPARISFDGARRVRLDESGDLVIETGEGEIRQRKPAIYQQDGAKRVPVSGGYVIAGDREIAFEVGAYDRTLALVIDPVLVYSTSIGGIYNDNANAVAVDGAGNAYIAGVTTSTDFPTANPFQPSLSLGQVNVGIPSDAFVAKLNSSGTALLYSTYLGGGSVDGANAIAVDAEGNAYVTGYAASTDFPTSPDAFQAKAVSGGSAFVTKLSSSGNALKYSTYLGGPGSNSFFSPHTTSSGTSIAVSASGSAYVTGYTLSESFPLRRAAQDQFNKGLRFSCCPLCLHNLVFGLDPAEDAFVTKLNPSGTGLVYSTYLGGSAQDEANGIAIDLSGNAYVTGRTCSRDFASNQNAGGASDTFVVKLSSSGREFVYSRLLGGNGDDAGNSIAVDASGNAYVAGQTDSTDFPATQSALQSKLGGSASYVTTDGGVSWITSSGLPGSPVNVIALDPTNPLTVYAGFGSCLKPSGLFKSTDAGHTWKPTGIQTFVVNAIAVDPKNSSTVYADRQKSTDGGATWTSMAFPDRSPVFGVAALAIDPVNAATVYLSSGGFLCGDAGVPPAFLKTTNGGLTWNPVLIGGSTVASSILFDPKNPSTIYATLSNLYKSTDSGATWRVPYEGDRSLVLLAIDPTNTSTLYLRDTPSNINKLFKSTDGGMSFSVTGLTGVPIKGLVVDQTNSSTLYAATGDLGSGGGVLKSTDGGQTWKPTDLTGITVNALAIDPSNSSRIYAGTYYDTDGFLAKFDAAGTGLVYSTYFGTRSPDSAAGIGVDAAGHSYVTGKTFSDRFFTKDAVLAEKAGGPLDTATFVTKLDAAGAAILFSTYLGSNEPSFGSAIAVDKAGKIYVAGTTGLPAIVPSARVPKSVHGGSDAFAVKVSLPARISGASISGKNLFVTGEGFDLGAVILVDGAEQRSRNDQTNPATTLIGKKSAKSIAPGQSVTIQVRNSDGLISEPFGFTR